MWKIYQNKVGGVTHPLTQTKLNFSHGKLTHSGQDKIFELFGKSLLGLIRCHTSCLFSTSHRRAPFFYFENFDIVGCIFYKCNKIQIVLFMSTTDVHLSSSFSLTCYEISYHADTITPAKFFLISSQTGLI